VAELDALFMQLSEILCISRQRAQRGTWSSNQPESAGAQLGDEGISLSSRILAGRGNAFLRQDISWDTLRKVGQLCLKIALTGERCVERDGLTAVRLELLARNIAREQRGQACTD
jgi:hypothetical protein